MKNTEASTINGYLYVANEDNELFRDVKIGDEIIKPVQEPPYMVVDHFLHKVLITRWPGKLYLVRVLNPAGEKELNEGLVKDVWYTRTWGVKILEEIPIEHIFGDNGYEIKQLIDLITNITVTQMEKLSTFPLEHSRQLYSKAWKNWISLTDRDYAGLDNNFTRVIGTFSINQKYSSPVRNALSIISSHFDKKISRLIGDDAYEINEEGEKYLKSIWSEAQEQFLCAAISFESDNLLTQAEKVHLRKPVWEVFNL